jgi:hypothetical protein
MRTLIVFLLLACTGSPAFAWEKVLLPIVTDGREIPGAFGSRFVTILKGYNSGSSSLRLDANPWLPCPICPPAAIVPGTSEILVDHNVIGVGSFLFIEISRTRDLSLQLRAQDLSRQASTWGTELPIVRELDLFQDQLLLIDIPSVPDFRQTLRIYDFDSDTPSSVIVRFYEEATQGRGLLLHEIQVPLMLPHSHDLQPRQASISLWTEEFAALRGVPRFRIEVLPATPGLRFWAFATVTHNETQHITLITPTKL